jgi:hypothetical protein
MKNACQKNLVNRDEKRLSLKSQMHISHTHHFHHSNNNQQNTNMKNDQSMSDLCEKEKK